MAKVERLEDQVEYKVKMNRKIIHKGSLVFQENFGSILDRDIIDKVRNAIYEHPEFETLGCRDMNYLRHRMGVDSYFNSVDLSFFEEGNKVVLPFTVDDGKTKLRFECIFTAKPKTVKGKVSAHSYF